MQNRKDRKNVLITKDISNVKRDQGKHSYDRDLFEVVSKGSLPEQKKMLPSFSADLLAQDAVEEFQQRVLEATGAASYEVGRLTLKKASNALSYVDEPLEKTVKRLNIIAKQMAAMQPKDEVEGQLVSQLIVLHQQAMNWLERAMNTERVDFANTYLNGASKLLARYNEALASLSKYRRGGEQRVYVEHVHVHGGAQAIVGNVSNGGGVNGKN